MKKVVIKILSACLIVAGLCTGGYYGYKKYKESKSTVVTPSYVTMRATKTNLQVKVQGTGAVFAGTSRDITTSSAGEIKNLTAKLGDTVNKDSELFTISNDLLQQAIDKAQNALDKQKLQLSNAKNTLENAQANLASIKAGGTVNTISTQSNMQNGNAGKTLTLTDAQSALDKAKLDVDTAELAVKDAERELASAKNAKNSATVKSPIEGLIVTKNKNNSDIVQANTPILTVIDTNSFKVKVAVDELDIQKVKIGQKAEISVGAIKDKVYEGTVEQIALTGTSSNNVTTYDVIVAISNPENIKLGMNTTVNILIDSKDNALVIPAEALISRDGKSYVTVPNAEEGTKTSSESASAQGNASGKGNANRTWGTGNGKLVEIKTGLETENYVEILEGISEGQQLLVTLPQTTTTSTNSRNGMGGLSGNTGSSSSNTNRQPASSSANRQSSR